MRASHVIKGASSNLMCQELRESATNLEQSAALGNEIQLENGSKEELSKATMDVQEKYAVLKKAVVNYHEFLDSVNV